MFRDQGHLDETIANFDASFLALCAVGVQLHEAAREFHTKEGRTEDAAEHANSASVLWGLERHHYSN
jgi:hypothetical protein